MAGRRGGCGVVGLQDLARILSPALPRQDIQRQLVGLAVEVCEQGVVEEGVVGGSRRNKVMQDRNLRWSG